MLRYEYFFSFKIVKKSRNGTLENTHVLGNIEYESLTQDNKFVLP